MRRAFDVLEANMSIMADSGMMPKYKSRLGDTLVFQTAWLRPAAYQE